MRKQIFEIVEKSNPNNRISIIYDRVMFILIIISIIPLFFKQIYDIFRYIDIITGAVFIIDYLLRWLTADFKLNKPQRLSFVCYPFTPFAIIDLLSILPVVTPLNEAFKLFRLLRLSKVVRVLKVLRYSKSFNLVLRVMRKERQPLLTVCCFSIGYVILSALIMFTVEPNSFNTFFDAVYWAVITLTTVGYGDIYPVSIIGRVVSMFSSFIGIAIVAMPTGIIVAGFMNEINSTNT